MEMARPGYGRYVLVLLLGSYVLNSFDRSILSLLLEPISPVPGGVGPMTITMLLHNTLVSAERSVENTAG